jgi:hypothetical protein
MQIPHDYDERVYAGVLGKIIGVYVGRPFEGWSYERIMAELGEIAYYVHERRGVPQATRVAEWLAVPVIEGFVVRVDVERPHDLDTLWRTVRAQVAERSADARQRARASHYSRVGVGLYQPRPLGATDPLAAHNARTRAVAAERAQWQEELRATTSDWGYYQADAIRERVTCAAETAVLAQACALANEHGAQALPGRRHVLMQAGRAAATAQWHKELADACRRLRGDAPERSDDGGDPDALRRRLAEVAGIPLNPAWRSARSP